MNENEATPMRVIDEDAFMQVRNLLSATRGEEVSVAETFWVNTKLPSVDRVLPFEDDPMAVANSDMERSQSKLVETAVILGAKRYDSFPKVSLPEPRIPETVALRQSLEIRRSCREFDAERAIPLRSVSTILHYAYGWNSTRPREMGGYKFAPSAGSLYPLEFYLAASNIDGLHEDCLYHYRPTGHLLEEITSFRPEELTCLFLGSPWIEDVAGVIFLTGVLPRLRWKYGERGLRYLLLDAGHAAQSACILAAAVDTGMCPVVSFYDDKAHDFLDIDGLSEFAVYALPFGVPLPEPTDVVS